eukprot:sb/3468662/
MLNPPIIIIHIGIPALQPSYPLNYDRERCALYDYYVTFQLGVQWYVIPRSHLIWRAPPFKSRPTLLPGCYCITTLRTKVGFYKVITPWVAHEYLFVCRNLVLVANLVKPKFYGLPKLCSSKLVKTNFTDSQNYPLSGDIRLFCQKVRASGGCHAQIRRRVTKGGVTTTKNSTLYMYSRVCPGFVVDGSVQGSWNDTDQKKHVRDGSSERTCNSDVDWDKDAPLCRLLANTQTPKGIGFLWAVKQHRKANIPE